MAIDIKRPHTLGLEKAQTIANALAEDLSERFGVDYYWEGDHLHFERMGVSGNIEVSEQALHLTAELNFLLSYLEPKITEEVHRYLDEHFA